MSTSTSNPHPDVEDHGPAEDISKAQSGSPTTSESRRIPNRIPHDAIGSAPRDNNDDAKSKNEDPPLSQANSHPPLRAIVTPQSRLKRTKPTKSVETLETEISTTETKLAATLSRISKLPSFHQLSHDGDGNEDRTTFSSSSSSGTALQHPQPPPLLDSAALTYANSIVTRHITLLKEYNAIRDVAMGMLSLIADKEGKRLAEVMEERGVGEDD